MEIFVSVITKSACVPTTESYFQPQLSRSYLPLTATLIIELGIHREKEHVISFQTRENKSNVIIGFLKNFNLRWTACRIRFESERAENNNGERIERQILPMKSVSKTLFPAIERRNLTSLIQRKGKHREKKNISSCLVE